MTPLTPLSPDPKPEFATNRAGERVADAINAHLAHLRETWKEPPDLALATAYFNVGGYALLADELDHVARVRLLLGAEPLTPERRIRQLSLTPSPARAARAELRKALDGHAQSLAQDRDLLGFTLEADAGAKRLVTWLRSGKVEVRRLEDSFLHGKAFLVTTNDDGVIAGSSNFTYAGLAKNIELNLGQYQPHVVRRVVEWFDDLWEEAAAFDLASFYEERFEPHRPYLLYLRMLWERYGRELEEEAAVRSGIIHLARFQEDGLWRARRILEERNGVLIADEVGLGKTFIAGELIRQTVQDRRQRVLVVAPATLRDGPWRKFLEDQMLGVERISFEQLAEDRQLNPEADSGHLHYDPAEYSMIVIDEAHNLRNPSTLRAQAMRNLLSGTPPKELVMLTATPVNNSLWDLFHQLGYFIRNDAEFADVGIRSLRDHFAKAMAMNPDDLSPEHLFDVLDAVAVRRTRPFVKRYYPADRIKIGVQWIPITFPTPRVRKLSYDLNEVLPGFFDRFAIALDGPVDGGSAARPDVLTLARYAPSRYLVKGTAEAYELQLAGLLRSGLLKRFESSSCAFARTCRTMARSHDAFVALLDSGKVATGIALRDWVATDTDELGEVEEYLERHADILDNATDYDIAALRVDVAADRELLIALADEADSVQADGDPKLATLVEALADIAAEAERDGVGDEDTRDKRKVLIFTYYADTVDWIFERLERVVQSDSRLAAYRDRLVATSGSHGGKEDALWGFAPKTTDAPPGRDADLYDIVVTTDVLAEGVNLQQARHIINYDLPWNPMRLVQRHGRIDRIGSSHGEVFLRCIFPDEQLEALLQLEERLHRKLKQAAATVGAGEVLPGSTQQEVVFTESREEIDKLRSGDASIFEQGGIGMSALSGEEYRQELRAALEDPTTSDQIKSLPWGSGSGMAVEGAHAGYVFCVRVGDHPRIQFRYLDMREASEPVVVDDTLACLANARPAKGFDTPRVLSEETYEEAFHAWVVARADIVERWNYASDPANLAPKIPKAMSDAADLVRSHRSERLTLEETDELVSSLLAPYPERVLRRVRLALSRDATAAEIVEELAALVREEGMRPAPAPEPLPEITEDDVHLVAWLAIVPQAAEAHSG